MPLEAGSSEEAVGKNIAELRDAGHPENQAIAIAEKKAGNSKADSELIQKDAAGIALLAAGKVLLLKRGDGGDYPGHWCFPGGHTDPIDSTSIGDTPCDPAYNTAVRETMEEAGYLINGPLQNISYTDNGDIRFTTFGKNVKEFTPVLSGEHTEFGWFERGKYPEPMHPGCKLILDGPALDLIDASKMNELELARAMAAGYLPSPQRYMNMWLFAIRITGTGVAYRRAIEEFVFRDPSLYLNDDFLARCNGLQVIVEHPDKASLTSQEFQDRSIGSIFLPYIQGQEVWGIAKVYDATAAAIMERNQLSTSPTVVFSDPAENSTIKLEDGATLLIEGKPSLLDHVAICIRGVWDKGGPPSGVSTNQLQENQMNDEELKAKADAEAKEKEAAEAKAKADSDAKAKADADEKLSKFMDSVMQRMDSFEEKLAKKDADMPAAAMTAADKAKADAEAEEKKKADEEEAKKKADAEEEAKVKADAEETRKRIADLESRLPKQLSDADYASMADAQAKADSVYSVYGDQAPRPLNGEDLLSYKKRLATKIKTHSAQWKDVDLSKLDETVFAIAEAKIYADAEQAATSPTGISAGNLREVTRRLRGGHEVSEFYGDPEAWMRAFKTPTFKSRVIMPTKH